ncbi:UNVERIFIED_CONTAM: hypothetical protein BEN50_19650 [Euhalothece sp. KZN 001]
MTDQPVICPRTAVKPGSTVVFTASGPSRTEEGFLIHGADGCLHAYVNRCPHLIDVRLDRGAGGRIRDGELLCQRHGASFDPASGECTFGPPEGALLEEFEIEVTEGAVILTDDRFDTVEVGLDPARSPATAGDREI